MENKFYDAVSIEHSFSMLVGKGRGALGGLVDADVFRHGDTKEIGKLLQKISKILEKRVASISYKDWEIGNGKPKIRLEIAIKELYELGKNMETMKKEEPNDYHWSLVGLLISIIASLLDHIEGKVIWG